MQDFEERKKWYLSHKNEINKFNQIRVREDNKWLVELDKEAEKELDEVYKQLGSKRRKRHYKLITYKELKDKDLIKMAELSLTNSNKEIERIDLTPYLNKIKNKKIEYLIALFIKDDKVIDEIITTSKRHGAVNLFKYTNEIMEKAKKLNAKVYTVHNHPLWIQAIPSFGDIRSAKALVKKNNNNGIEFVDSAIVTNYDYYSYSQRKIEAKKILKVAKRKGINNKLELEIIELMYLTRIKGLNRYKKRYIYQFIDEKREDIDKIPTKEYEEIRRNAKKHLLEIEKELNLD